jgi:hypothetical protein
MAGVLRFELGFSVLETDVLNHCHYTPMLTSRVLGVLYRVAMSSSYP